MTLEKVLILNVGCHFELSKLVYITSFFKKIKTNHKQSASLIVSINKSREEAKT